MVVELTVDAVDGVAVRGHDASSCEMDDATNNGTADQERPAADAIDHRKDPAGGHKENYVLDDG